MFFRFAVLTVTTIAAAIGICSAQETITVRIVDSRDARPIKGQRIWLQYYPHDERNIERVHKVSTPQGMAIFQLPQSKPEKVFISLGLGDTSCSGQGEFKTEELLKNGVTLAGNCPLNKSVSGLSAKPGEVILFARPQSWWHRALAPLETE
jgi:hypothetical protein